MAIINVTAANTIVFVQRSSEEGNRNPSYTGLLGDPDGVLGGFNLLPGRAELHDYVDVLGTETSTSGRITVGQGGVLSLEVDDGDLTSQLGTADSIPGKTFTLGLGSDITTDVIRTASNTISFSQTADVVAPFVLTASNAITFTQTGLVVGSVIRTASNTIVFSQSEITAGPVNVTASNLVAFTQVARPGVISRTASSQITFTGRGSSGTEGELTASNTIGFTQNAGSGLLSRTASSQIVFTQTAFSGTVVVTGIELTASNTVAFTQTNNRGLIIAGAQVLTASSTLALTQRAIFPIVLTAVNDVAFSQTTVRNVGKSVTQVIEFTQSAIANVVRNMTASNVIEFKHGFSAVQFRDGVPVKGTAGCDATKLYSPYSGGDVPVVRPVAPILVRHTDVVFFTPAGTECTATSSLTLRTPNFGDRDRNKFARINRESRGGSLTIFRDPNWPKERSLVMDFSGIKDSEVYEVIAFLENTLGQEVSFRDWNGRIWTGFITNPDSAITRTGVNRNDIALEMEVFDNGLVLNACNTIVFTQSNVREVV